jgi:hypothetical protein
MPVGAKALVLRMGAIVGQHIAVVVHPDDALGGLTLVVILNLSSPSSWMLVQASFRHRR